MDNVDLALLLALDCSASVTYEEFGLMAGGLAGALRDPAVISGLIGGEFHASLGALLLWSGSDAQELLVDWTRIASRDDALGFADAVDNTPRVVRGGLTAIGQALIACLAVLDTQPARARRQVIDVAGDGSSNDGTPPGPVRDRLAAAGITINGLCILHEEPDLLAYYTREVIGGPGSFAMTCPDYPAFSEAMRQKLTREIENRPVA
ncbi:MAG: DUF1194 domain-containing protein [Acidisphaera sp.]|nr:DUF1194 domain-containing protein [Acidisphaera sp.]